MMSNIRPNYSIGLQVLKPVHTAYGAICMPIRKLLMHWHHSSTSQWCGCESEAFPWGPKLIRFINVACTVWPKIGLGHET